MSILDLARSASTVTADDVAPCILIYGPSGSGKTHTAVKGGKPFVLLTERNGLTTVLQANPQADYLLVEDRVELDASGKPIRNEKGELCVVKALDLVRQVVIAAKSGELTKRGYDRLVIDSETELQRLFKDEIIAAKGIVDDTQEKFTLPDWGILADRMRRFHRTIRSLPVPVVVTALEEEVQDGGDSVTRRPAFEGRKTAQEVAQFFSAVGFQHKRVKVVGEGENATQEPIYRVVFDAPPRYLTKSCRPAVYGSMEPDVVGWLAVMARPSLSKVEEAAAAG